MRVFASAHERSSLMAMRQEVKHIVREDGVLGGKPHIEGHRIGVHHIAWWCQQGESAESLAQAYGLTPAEVHAALVYYYDHKDEIDRDLEEEAAQHAASADADTSPIAQCMRAAVAERKRRTQR
jgi:uncharacterized protein (DUF433 family)